jgi:hypothetical protein
LRLLEGGQMVRACCAAFAAVLVFSTSALVWAQADDAAGDPDLEAAAATSDADADGEVDVADAPAADSDAAAADADPPAEEGAAGSASEMVDDAKEAVEDVADRVDRSDEAKKISAGILNPIYTLAEKMSFPYFHWLAFAAMVAGVISFGLQLVLGKLIVLSRMSLSPSEILADSLGLVISLVGLVLTTQAAAENSTFTTSSFAVISSAAVGVLAGFIFYVWGQRQELLAVEGRRRVAAAEKIAAANKK